LYSSSLKQPAVYWPDPWLISAGTAPPTYPSRRSASVLSSSIRHPLNPRRWRRVHLYQLSRQLDTGVSLDVE